MKFIRNIFLTCVIFIFLTNIFFSKEACAITIKEEEDLSREFLKVVLAHYNLIKDPFIVNYVNRIGQKIVSVLPEQPYPYRFYIIKEDVYNAFATPAGHIFINSGLLGAMDSEDELAGILSHEIAHVVCRHISQKIERSKKFGLATLAGMAAGIFLGIGGASEAANAVTVGTMAATQSAKLAYSRKDERQADKIGLKYLAKAGYSGMGLLTMLKKIRSKHWFTSNQIPTYMTTHPATEERIAYIDSWLESNSNPSKKKVLTNEYEFEIARAKIVALFSDETFALKKFKTDTDKHPESFMAHYGYGLILSRKGSYKDAIAHFKSALAKKVFDPNVLKELGKLYFISGRYSKALNIFEGALSIAPDDPEMMLYTGRTQTELKMFETSISTFEKLIAKNPDFNQSYYFLGETYSKLGKTAEAHFSLGIFYKNRRDFKNAAFHLKRALRNIKNSEKKHEIEKMLKEIKNQQFPVEPSKNEKFSRLVKEGENAALAPILFIRRKR